MSPQEDYMRLAGSINQACDAGIYDPLDLVYTIDSLPTWMNIGVSSLLYHTTGVMRTTMARRYAVLLSRCWDRWSADWNDVVRTVIIGLLTQAIAHTPRPVPAAIQQLIIAMYQQSTHRLRPDTPDDVGMPLVAIATLKGCVPPTSYPSIQAAMFGIMELAYLAQLLQSNRGSGDAGQFISKLTMWLVKDQCTDVVGLLTVIFTTIEDNLRQIPSRPLPR